ncbi:flotillin-like protein FloA [Planctopirus hydrillae]|uniref:Flotillin-like protein FloA n=1 Tax=Planctopirus hydrillae TaxID=1841610 RepID=A0A1C3EDC2_9PLAN|nr:flotillin-like protein FloA [Planctopirus hydrillae]ODA31238.1 hypothetical protein A6X21_22450 [Planctopirus hydrillae]
MLGDFAADSGFLLAQNRTTGIVIGVTAVVVILGLILTYLLIRYFSLWIQCKLTGVGIGMFQLVTMSIRKVDPDVIVRAKIMAVQSGMTDTYPISTRDLEAHYLSRGNVLNVIKAMVAAYRAKIELSWQTAQAIDLAGRDLLEAVRTSVYPKIIDCPDPRKGSSTLDAVAQDGIQLKARARVTVRTNLQQLIGGATEETIIARVGQGIVRAIGSTENYKKVLENPDRISQTVLELGLEANTAFEIVSIDIADIDVGENVGARLSADQAEADMRVAQANAEQRRAEFTAREQEMIAEVQANRAEVVLAEAEVPKAVAEAFQNGALGLLDYYELKNVQADTQMRSAIAGQSVTQR